MTTEQCPLVRDAGAARYRGAWVWMITAALVGCTTSRTVTSDTGASPDATTSIPDTPGPEPADTSVAESEVAMEDRLDVQPHADAQVDRTVIDSGDSASLMDAPVSDADIDSGDGASLTDAPVVDADINSGDGTSLTDAPISDADIGSCPDGGISCAATDGATTCTNPQRDPNNCGACGVRCCAGCHSGMCTADGRSYIICPTGPDGCHAWPVNPWFDPNNCGMCGAVCAVGQHCVEGLCR